MKPNRKITLTIEDEETGQKVSANSSTKDMEELKSSQGRNILLDMYEQINDLMDKMENDKYGN